MSAPRPGGQVVDRGFSIGVVWVHDQVRAQYALARSACWACLAVAMICAGSEGPGGGDRGQADIAGTEHQYRCRRASAGPGAILGWIRREGSTRAAFLPRQRIGERVAAGGVSSDVLGEASAGVVASVDAVQRYCALPAEIAGPGRRSRGRLSRRRPSGRSIAGLTPSPTSTISPAVSWPAGIVSGSVCLRYWLRSEPQIPSDLTLMTAPPGPGSWRSMRLISKDVDAVVERGEHVGHCRPPCTRGAEFWVTQKNRFRFAMGCAMIPQLYSTWSPKRRLAIKVNVR